MRAKRPPRGSGVGRGNHNHPSYGRSLNYEVINSGYEHPCWIWTGATLKDRHGRVTYGYMTTKGKNILAHRYYFEQYRGEIPSGLHLDHYICHNKLCVFPWHVEPVTPQENNRRLVKRMNTRRNVQWMKNF